MCVCSLFFAMAHGTWNDIEVMTCVDKITDKTFVGAERRLTVCALTCAPACMVELAASHAQCKWVHYVQGVDSNPRARSALHYVAVARAMATAVGSVMVEDFADASVRESMRRRLPADDSCPFASDEDEAWGS